MRDVCACMRARVCVCVFVEELVICLLVSWQLEAENATLGAEVEQLASTAESLNESMQAHVAKVSEVRCFCV